MTKVNKRIFCFIMALITLITLFGMNSNLVASAYSAVNEEYNANSSHYYTMHLEDDNWTPGKRILSGSKVNISGNFRIDDSYYYSPVRLTFKVYDNQTGALLGSTQVVDTYSNGSNTVSFHIYNISVWAGREIQLYMDVSSVSNPPGPYRKGYLSYTVSVDS